MALDYLSSFGVATSIGHSPISGLINSKAGSINSVAEALTNIIWAPLNDGIEGVSLSANWMWPCKNKGEDSRLFDAVESLSNFAISLGVNVPTGKDSLSMSQKYKDKQIKAPGTVIVSATANCDNIYNVIEPVFKIDSGSIFYINISKDNFKLGGSAFAQIIGNIGKETPCVKDAKYFVKVFNLVQD